MGDYAWSEHIVMVFLACQITIKNVQVQLTVKGKTTPDSYTSPPKAVVPEIWLSWNEVFRWRQTLARPSVGRSKKRLSSDQWTRLHVWIVHPKWSCDQSNRAWRWRNVNCGRFMGLRAYIPWWCRRLITVRVLMWSPNAIFHCGVKLSQACPIRSLKRARFYKETRLSFHLMHVYNSGRGLVLLRILYYTTIDISEWKVYYLEKTESCTLGLGLRLGLV